MYVFIIDYYVLILKKTRRDLTVNQRTNECTTFLSFIGTEFRKALIQGLLYDYKRQWFTVFRVAIAEETKRNFVTNVLFVNYVL